MTIEALRMLAIKKVRRQIRALRKKIGQEVGQEVFIVLRHIGEKTTFMSGILQEVGECYLRVSGDIYLFINLGTVVGVVFDAKSNILYSWPFLRLSLPKKRNRFWGLVQDLLGEEGVEEMKMFFAEIAKCNQ